MAINSTLTVPNGTSFSHNLLSLKSLFLLLTFGLLSVGVWGQNGMESNRGSDTWNGNVDENWHNPNNWESGKVPNSGDDVTIALNDNKRYPIIKNENANIKSLSIVWPANDNRPSLTIQDGKLLDINKTFTNNADVFIDNGLLTVGNSGSSAGDGTISTNGKFYVTNNSIVTAKELSVENSGVSEWNMDKSELNILQDIDIWTTVYTGVKSTVSAQNLTIHNSGSSWVIDETDVFISNKFTSKGTTTLNNGATVQCKYLEQSTNGTTWELNDSSNLTVIETYTQQSPIILHDESLASIKNLNSLSTAFINDKSVLIVKEKIDLKNSITLSDNASLIQTSETDLNYYQNDYWSGELIVNRTARGIKNYDYVYWSSPVEGTEVSTLNNSTDRYVWYPTNIQAGYASNFGQWVNATGQMETGVGYITKGGKTGHTSGGDVNQNFTAEIKWDNSVGINRFFKINNGTINVTVTRGTYDGDPYEGPSSETLVTKYDDNWNLIGNPYPSAISADAFITANSGTLDAGDSVSGGTIEGGIRIWTHGSAPSSAYEDPFYANEGASYNPDDYITYTLSGSSDPGSADDFFIASCQGFFVLMRGDTSNQSENISFTNEMRTHTENYTNTDFYKEGNTKNRIWLNLKDSKDRATSMLIGYFDGAVDAKDPLYDAITMDPNTTSLYSIIDNEGFVIQGKANPFLDTDVVPLGIVSTKKDVYSIGISKLDGVFESTEQSIYLQDLYLNKVHDLRASPYEFATEKGTFNDRFVLAYNAEKLSIDDNITNSDLTILATREYIKVSTKTNSIKAVSIYDVLGRTLYTNNKFNVQDAKLNPFKPTNSPLIVKVLLSNGKTKTQKVIY